MFSGYSKMVSAYNPHGIEASRVVQITYGQELVPKVLPLMRFAWIRPIEGDTDPLELLAGNPATGSAREALTLEHL